MPLFVIVVLIVFLFGGGGYWGFNTYRAGWGLPGGLGLVLLILLIMYLAGGLHAY